MKRLRVLIIVTMLGVIGGLIVFWTHQKSIPNDSKEYLRNIRALNDSIQELQKDIEIYNSEIERLNLERNKIRSELRNIIKDNEKIDSTLADDHGCWATNIDFLTDYLSKAGSDWERYSFGDYETPNGSNK